MRRAGLIVGKQALALGLGVLVLALSGRAFAGPEKVAYPEGYRTGFVRYITIDRPDRGIVRWFYVNPEALAAARPDEPLPDGTVLIMEDHVARLDANERPVIDAQGRFISTDEVTNVFVMEKQPGWGAEYPPDVRNGEWEYAWFLPDGARKADAKFEGCFSCHMNRAERDFTFTFYKYVLDTEG
ncbi:MAG: cytochrome P460 family protein [Geminicoccaceae bacterium]